MALLKIATIGHPVLRERAREVTRDELAGAPFQQFIDDMVATMRDAGGAGLAANQVYAPVRACVIEVAANARYPYMPSWPLTILVNPAVEPTTDETFPNFEGCLSVPNLRGKVPRFAGVRVRALDREGRELNLTVGGLTAGTFQHELDHLDGTLFVDRVTDTRTLCTLSEFERFHREEVMLQAKELVARFGS
jgi:peptide deformylase